MRILPQNFPSTTPGQSVQSLRRLAVSVVLLVAGGALLHAVGQHLIGYISLLSATAAATLLGVRAPHFAVTHQLDEDAGDANDALDAEPLHDTTTVLATASDQRETCDEAIESTRVALRECAQSVESLGTGVSEASQTIDIARSMTFQILGQISELGDMSSRIANMVNVIRKITDQTNLLALNATIEAARAGERGKGFAVVASEVRKLAQDSRDATETIDSIVNEISEMTEATIEVANMASDEVESARQRFGSVSEQVSVSQQHIETVAPLLASLQNTTEAMSASLSEIAYEFDSIDPRRVRTAPRERFGLTPSEEAIHVVH